MINKAVIALWICLFPLTYFLGSWFTTQTTDFFTSDKQFWIENKSFWKNNSNFYCGGLAKDKLKCEKGIEIGKQEIEHSNQQIAEAQWMLDHPWIYWLALTITEYGVLTPIVYFSTKEQKK